VSAEQLTRKREYDSPHVELFVSFFVRARNNKTWSVIVQTEIFEGVLNAVWHPSLKLVIQIDNNSIFVHYTNKSEIAEESEDEWESENPDDAYDPLETTWSLSEGPSLDLLTSSVPLSAPLKSPMAAMDCSMSEASTQAAEALEREEQLEEIRREFAKQAAKMKGFPVSDLHAAAPDRKGKAIQGIQHYMDSAWMFICLR